MRKGKEERTGERREAGGEQEQILMKREESMEETEAMLAEISEVMTRFASKVDEQEELIDMIVIHHEDATLNVEEAGRQLEQAHEYQKGSGIMLAVVYLVMGVLLLLFDRITSVYV